MLQLESVLLSEQLVQLEMQQMPHLSHAQLAGQIIPLIQEYVLLVEEHQIQQSVQHHGVQLSIALLAQPPLQLHIKVKAHQPYKEIGLHALNVQMDLYCWESCLKFVEQLAVQQLLVLVFLLQNASLLIPQVMLPVH